MLVRFAKAIVFGLLFLSPVTPVLAVPDIETQFDLLYGDNGVANCESCHASGGQSAANLNAYGQRLQATLGSPPFSTNQINNSLRLAEFAGPNGSGFASSISGSQSLTVSATTNFVTIPFSPGRVLTGGNASISNFFPPTKNGYSYLKLGNSERIFINLTPLERGNIRRSANSQVSFQFVPLNSANFRPTGTGANQARALNRLSLSFENAPPNAVDDTYDMVSESIRTLNENVITEVNSSSQVDRDIDGDPFLAELIAPVDGLSFEANGDFTYSIPNLMMDDTVTFQYRLVETGTGLQSNVATVTINISSTNDAPVAIADTFTTSEDVAISGDVTAANPTTQDSDPDGNAIEALLASDVSRGTLTPTLDGGGVWRGAFDYTPDPDANGNDSFTYRLSDGTATSDIVTASIAITPVNDPPVAVADSYSANKSAGAISGNVITSLAAGGQRDADIEGDAFEAGLVSGPSSGGGALDPTSLTLNPDGSFTFTIPPAFASGTVTFEYRVVETQVGGLASGPVTVALTVTPLVITNMAPVAIDDAFTTDEDTNLSGNLLDANPTTADSDPDADALEVSQNLAVAPTKGTLTPTLDAGVWRGAFEYVPNPNESGTDQFTYILSDGNLTDTAVATIAITPVNDPPVAVADSFAGNKSDGAINGNVLDGTGSSGTADNDVEATPLQAELVSGPASGAGAIDPASLALNADGSFVFTIPDAIPSGVVTFQYRAIEVGGGVESDPVTVTLMIDAAPQQPPVAVDDAFTTAEDTSFVGNVLEANPTTDDSDANGDALEVVSLSQLTNPSKGTLTRTLVGGRWLGAFEYTPNPNETGVDQYSYTLSDGARTDTATITITITEGNDSPVGTSVTLATINESQGAQTIDLFADRFVIDADDSAAMLTVTDFAQSGDALVFNRTDNIVTYDTSQFEGLDDDENVTFTLTYVVEDEEGARSEPIEITQTIIGLDNGLGRIAGEYANTLRSRYNEHFLPSSVVNDSCHSCHNPGQVAVEVERVEDCSTTVFNPYGFAICIDRDASQPPLSDLLRRLRSREIDFAPTLMSAPPLEVDDTATVGETIGGPLPANPGQTVQGTPSTVVDYAIVNGAGNLAKSDDSGQFSIDQGGQVTVAGALTPGTYTLDIRPINDAGQLDTNGNPRQGVSGFYPIERSLLRFVTITVRGAAPGATDDTFNVAQGSSSMLDVLTNDGGGDVNSVTIGTAPTNGTATVNADNTIAYMPNPAFTGDDSFTYRSRGLGGVSRDATVVVSVVTADGAVAVADRSTAVGGRVLEIDVTANDLGQRPFTTTLVSLPSQGSAVVDGTLVRFTPPTDFSGAVTLRYRVANAVAGSEANVTIQVAQVSGEALENGTDDPALKPIARSLGDSCSAIAGGSAPTADQSDLLNICNLIASDIANGSNIDGALDAIRNEELLAVRDIAATNGRVMRGAVFDRLRAVRGGGAGGIDVSGVNVAFGGQSISASDFQTITNYLGSDGKTSLANGHGVSGAVGGFVSGEVVFGDRDTTSNERGYDLTSYSLTAGADYRVRPDVIVGGAVSISQTETDFSGGGGIESNSYQLAIYGSLDNIGTPGLRLDGLVAGGKNTYDSSRRINFMAGGQTVDRVATADFDGDHFNAVARLEYDLSKLEEEAWLFETDIENLGPWEVSLFTELDYLRASTDSYTEQGAGGLSLRVDDQSFESLVGDIGVNIGLPIQMETGKLTPFIEVSANKEFMKSRPTLTASFAAANGATPFTVSGDENDEFFARFVVGAKGEFLDSDITVEYETTLGRENLTENRFTLSYGQTVFGNDRLGLGAGIALAQDDGADTEFEFTLDYKLEF